MNKKIVKATTAATLVSTIVSPCATVLASGEANHTETIVKESDVSVKDVASVEEAKKELDLATEKNKKALEAQQEALNELNLAKEEKEKAVKRLEEAVKKAEEAKATAEALLAKKQTESKENFEILNTQYADAQKAQKEAEAYLEEQQKLLEAQIALQEAANKKLEEAQKNVTVTEEDVANKQDVLNQATAKLESATNDLNQAKANVESLKNEINDAQAKKEQAEADLKKTEEEKEQAEAEVSGAEEAVKNATAAYEEAVKKVEEGSPELKAAREEAAVAQQALDQAKATLNEKETAKANAQQALLDAQNLVVDAENGITEADKETAIANAAMAVADAQAGCDAAQAEINEAQAKVDAAQGRVDAANATYMELEKERETFSQQLEATKQKKEEILVRIEQLNSNKNTLTNALHNQTVILQDRLAKQKEAEEAYANAQTALDTAKSEKDNAENAVKEAELRAEQARQAVLSAEEKIKSGSLGFFAEMGCQEALDRIKKYSTGTSNSLGEYSQYWMFGDERDATSLKNMKEALEYIKYCRDFLRKEQENGNIEVSDKYAGDFKVSLDQMAKGQVGANISSITETHSGKVGAENLIWGMFMTPESAYNSWYTAEKKLYDNGENDPSKIGHYTNLRDSANNYSVIGFGIHDSVWNEDGTFKHSPTYSQTFTTTSIVGDSEDKFVYTVDRYEELFMNYYNKVYSQLDAEKAEKEASEKALEEAKSRFETAKNAVTDTEAKTNTAKEALDTANLYALDQQSIVNDIQNLIDESDREKAEKEAEVKQAEADCAKLDEKIKEQDEKLKATKKESEDAKKAVEDAKDALQGKKDAKDAKDTLLEEAVTAYEKLTGNRKLPTKAEAEKMLLDAKTAKDKAIQKLEDAKKNEQEKVEALDQTKKEIEALLKEVAEKENVVVEKNDRCNEIFLALFKDRQDKVDALNEAKQTLTDAKANLEQKEAEVKKAESTYEKGSKELLDVLNEMENAKADYDSKLDAYNTSKEAYDTAKEDYENVVAAILPLREARAEYEDAVSKRKEQEEKVTEADKAILEKEALTVASQKAAEDAKKDYDVLSTVTFDGLMDTPMTEDAYLYLNAYVDEYKKYMADKEQADKDSKEGLDKISASEAKYAEAKNYATQTTADLLIAQDNYAKAVEADKKQNEEKPETKPENNNKNTGKEDKKENSGKENTGKENTSKKESGKENTGKENTGKENTGKENTGKSETNSETKQVNAPKTADLSNMGIASFGLFGSATLAAVATMFKKKRRNDEE